MINLIILKNLKNKLIKDIIGPLVARKLIKNKRKNKKAEKKNQAINIFILSRIQ